MQTANAKAAEPNVRGQLAGASLPNNGDGAAAASHGNSRPLIARQALSPSQSSGLPHGYNDSSTPITPTVSAFDTELQIHPNLRSPGGYAPAANMMSTGGQPPPEHPSSMAGPSTGPPGGLTDHDMVDRSIGDHGMGDSSAEGRKAKRELSQSKRAAQNRAAQRAFRQRKEGYIKKLEQQVRDYGELENSFKSMQSENYSLREYIIHLQSRLLDLQVEPPQPPPNINLAHPHSHTAQAQAPLPTPSVPVPEPVPNTGSASATSLDAVAQAVQNLSRSEQMTSQNPNTDDRTDEELTRQLQQADGLPALPEASM